MTSCVTNAYRQSDYPKKPLQSSVAVFTSFVPGLTQAINGEYLEALFYAGGALLGLYMYTNADEIVVEPDYSTTPKYLQNYEEDLAQERKEMRTAGLTYFMLWAIPSYFDGVITTEKRTDQWNAIFIEEKETQRLTEERNAETLRIQAKNKADEEAARVLEIEKQKKQEALKLLKESRHREAIDSTRNMGIPLLIENVSLTSTDRYTTGMQMTLRNISEKRISRIVVEIIPLDEFGERILPDLYQPSNTETQVIYCSIAPNETVPVEYKTIWDYRTVKSVSFIYLKTLFEDGTVIELNNSELLDNKMIYKEEM